LFASQKRSAPSSDPRTKFHGSIPELQLGAAVISYLSVLIVKGGRFGILQHRTRYVLVKEEFPVRFEATHRRDV
jgi:hypothetical protein